MTIIRKTLAEIEAHPYRMTDEERQRILSMTEEEIEAAALPIPTIRRGPMKNSQRRDVSAMSGWRRRSAGRDLLRTAAE